MRGAGATLLSTSLNLGIQIGSALVLARLLAPRDFGLLTMVTTFSLLFTNFGLNGFTEAVLQAEKISHSLLSNLFWINVGAGLILTIAFASAGRLLARFYHDPEITRVVLGVAATILITSFSVQHLALLKRAMQFSIVSANDVFAKVVSVSVSIILGRAGWGYWALVAGTVGLALSTSIGAWYCCRWIPGPPRRASGTRAMLRFGMHTYGTFGINYFARNVDNLLVGWRFGSVSLAFYKKAYDLFALSVSQSTGPLTSIAVAALSRLREDPDRYRQYFLRALGAVAFLGMGLSADLTLVGKDLILLLFGPRWKEAGRIFTFFGPGIGIMLINSLNGWIHLSVGRADRGLRWSIIQVCAMTTLFLLALPWGAAGIAVAWTAAFWLLTFPALKYAGEPIGLRCLPVFRVVWKYIGSGLLAGYTSVLITSMFPLFFSGEGAPGALKRILVTSVLLASEYLVLVIVMHRGFRPIRELVEILKDAASRKATGSEPKGTRYTDATA
jgi:PST family polysaccharide transporter